MKSENDAQCLIWGKLLLMQQTPWGGAAEGRGTGATKLLPQEFPLKLHSASLHQATIALVWL